MCSKEGQQASWASSVTLLFVAIELRTESINCNNMQLLWLLRLPRASSYGSHTCRWMYGERLLIIHFPVNTFLHWKLCTIADNF